MQIESFRSSVRPIPRQVLECRAACVDEVLRKHKFIVILSDAKDEIACDDGCKSKKSLHTV